MGVLSKLVPLTRPLIGDRVKPFHLTRRTFFSSLSSASSSPYARFATRANLFSSSSSSSFLSRQSKARELVLSSGRVAKRSLTKTTAFSSSSPPSSEAAIRQAWQRSWLPTALLATTGYLWYDNRRLKRTLSQTIEEEEALLQEQQQQLIAASALVVSEQQLQQQQQQSEWTTPQEQKDAVEESGGVDSVETPVEPIEAELEKDPVDPEPQESQQNSG